MRTLEGLRDAYLTLPEQLNEVLRRWPEAKVIRNDVGNLAIISEHDQYVGYIDVLTGEVVIEV